MPVPKLPMASGDHLSRRLHNPRNSRNMRLPQDLGSLSVKKDATAY